jgi:hypothetical protein
MEENAKKDGKIRATPPKLKRPAEKSLLRFAAGV